jgi:rhodanese-related sulfurtransferase
MQECAHTLVTNHITLKEEKMHKLSMIESVYNLLDMGIFLEIAKRARKTRIEMDPKNFLKHLILGKGYKEYTPLQLSNVLKKKGDAPLIVDLRDKDTFKKSHIPEAVQHPFDFFLRDVLINDGYAAYKNRPIVLVCDTGQKSKVAASILSDEGFSNVFSLNRGMRRWTRWQKVLSNCRLNRDKPFHICKLLAD